ncbi:MAG: tRNA (guanosine(37)-N1)-methyltransferase TrmD [Alistipes sp.]
MNYESPCALTSSPRFPDSWPRRSRVDSQRAQDKGLVEIVVHNLHDYARPPQDHRRLSVRRRGGHGHEVRTSVRTGRKLQSERPYDEIIYTSPDGIRYDQHEANRLSTLENIIILCGHYKGIDHRIREHLVTREISIGDYVLTGGELAACIIADSVVRIIPGAIGDEASALTDSFQDNRWLPGLRGRWVRGWRVPDVICRATSPDRQMAGRRGLSARSACALTCSTNSSPLTLPHF